MKRRSNSRVNNAFMNASCAFLPSEVVYSFIFMSTAAAQLQTAAQATVVVIATGTTFFALRHHLHNPCRPPMKIRSVFLPSDVSPLGKKQAAGASHAHNAQRSCIYATSPTLLSLSHSASVSISSSSTRPPAPSVPAALVDRRSRKMTPPAARNSSPNRSPPQQFQQQQQRQQHNATELDALLSSHEQYDSELLRRERLDSIDAVNKALALSIGEVAAPDEDASGQWFSWRTLWAYAGPGWLMSIAYVDPGNLESDLQAGAYGGYQLIWVLFGATVMGFFLQVLAARLGVVTGKNLAEVCTREYPRWASLVLWVMTEIAIVGSDIQEVLGSAIAFQILFDFPLWVGCLITGLDTFTFLLLHRYGIRKLEAFFVALIAIMLVCFFVNFVRGGIDTLDIAAGFLPEVQRYAVTQAVGILGAVIMPHNIFLHSALVQTRRVDIKNPRKVHEANKYFAIEAGGALFVSFLINLAVLGVFSKGFFSPDCTSSYDQFGVNSACVPGGTADGPTYGECALASGKQGMCQGIGLSQAGQAMSEMLGGYAEIIWAIGLLAAGQSSTMTGTYAGQFVMEGFLNLRLSPWKRVAVTRCVALVPALVVAMLSQEHPEDSDRMDEFLNVLQSIQLPFALLPVLVFTSSKQIMGPFANGSMTITVGWLLGAIVCAINLYLISVNLEGMELSAFGLGLLFIAGLSYFLFLGFLVKDDVALFYRWLKTKFAR